MRIRGRSTISVSVLLLLTCLPLRRIAHPKQGRTVINGMSQCTATGVVYDRDGAGAANIMTQGITFLKYGRVQYRTEKQKM